jgi:glycosyltransferase involved in cell wall biosynthesis
MESLKILIVSSPGLPTPAPAYSGLEMVNFNIALGMHKRGHKVTVVASVDSDASRYPDGIDIIKTVYSALLPIPEQESFELYDFKTEGKDFDIVHDSTHQHHSILLDRFRHQIHTVHDDANFQQPPRRPLPCFVGISYSHSRRINEMCPGIVARTCWNGVDTKLHRPVDVEQSDRFLFVGRIQWLKGVHMLADVCRQNNIPLDIVGDDSHFGGQDGFVKSVKNLCDGQLLKYIGPVSNEEKVRRMAAARAVIVPSMFYEPFGLVAAEAQACGTPVIVSDLGGLKEQVRPMTGHVFSHFYEIPELCRRVTDTDKMAQTPFCLRNVDENFSAEKMCDRYEVMYRDILNGKEW